MKRHVMMLLTGGLAVGLAGCAEESSTGPTASFAPPTKSAPAADGVLVTVKMPNMT